MHKAFNPSDVGWQSSHLCTLRSTNGEIEQKGVGGNNALHNDMAAFRLNSYLKISRVLEIKNIHQQTCYFRRRGQALI